jgi:hypothetical protein
MASSSAFDFVVGFFEVVGTNLSERTKATLVSLAGAHGFADDESDENREVAEDQKSWNANSIGAVGRPLPPNGKLRASGLGVRTADGVVPLAFRDPRLEAAFPNGVAKGTTGFAGYGKGFYTLTLVDPEDPDSTGIHVLYAPYEFSGGVATKAHSITLDTTSGNEIIGIVHADGHAFILNKDGTAVMKNKAGDVYIQVSDSGGMVNGNFVVNGGATIGSPTAAIPVGLAPPIITYLTALEELLATIAAATVPSTAPAVTTFVGAQAATKVAITALKLSAL